MGNDRPAGDRVDALGRGTLLPGPKTWGWMAAAAVAVLAGLFWLGAPRVLAWLMQPMIEGRPHHIEPLQAWHARIMILAWAVMIPVGMLIARFFKVTPRQPWPRVLDSQRWWKSHLRLQLGGVILTACAVALAWRVSGHDARLAELHRMAGWLVCALALLQVLGGFLRGTKGGVDEPGDHYDMTRRRVVFEYSHKALGYLSLLAALAAIISGLLHVNAPRWMPLLLACWGVGWLTAFAWLQYRGWCLDTYQAHWGAGLEHPGNRRPAIGPGIRRLPLKRD